ncbi:MAG: 3-phosphoshikimate 1-carboxyvinyltransferase [Pseudomonadota bacterium]|nr:3-phosphoshikimate 1-carboxyvinyltransferase [Pseudomonadota bacterium]
MHRPAASAPLTALPSRALAGRISVPGDKSISHRSLLLGALAIGETRISGLLEAADVMRTAAAMADLGADVERLGDGLWRIKGVGVGGLRSPARELDFGNSGTGARLSMGLIASTPLSARFTGDASLQRRPMGRVMEPLKKIGARFEAAAGDRLPATLHGAGAAVAIAYELPVASAQVKSAVLLAGLNIPGRTIVIEPIATRDHTERMLRAFGARLEVEQHGPARHIVLTGGQELQAQPIAVPADPSSAAFPIVAALLTVNSQVTVTNVMLNPTRTGLFTTLLEMGADLTIDKHRSVGGEDVGDITARSSRLRGVTVPASRAASMIDEYPVLAVAACFAHGTTRMEGLGELRVKESDRLAAVAAGLAANGARPDLGADWLAVEGGRIAGGGLVKSHLDHRIAMSFLVLGLAAKEPVTVDDETTIATSFPGFRTTMAGLGGRFESREGGD